MTFVHGHLVPLLLFSKKKPIKYNLIYLATPGGRNTAHLDIQQDAYIIVYFYFYNSVSTELKKE